MQSPGDRRNRIRFEVFGPFWGTFDVGEPVRVLDLTATGALIEAEQPLAVDSIQSIQLTIDGQPAIAEAQVKHIRAVPRGRLERYLVGLEFLGAPMAFLEAVDRLVTFRTLPAELT